MPFYNVIANKINLIPITGFTIWAIPGSETFQGKTGFFNVEGESSLNIDPVTRTTDRGRDITLGYNLTANLYLPYNDFKDTTADNVTTYSAYKAIEYAIQDMSKGLSPTQILLHLGNMPSAAYAEGQPTNIINSTKGAVISIDGTDKCSMTQKIESVEYRLRSVVTIKAFIKNPLKSWGNSQFILTM